MFEQVINQSAKRRVGRPSLVKDFATKCFFCDQTFYPKSQHYHFCENCKTHSETYRFADWMTSAS